MNLELENPPTEEDLELWPENWQPVHLFAQLLTQWHMGWGGPVGLIYESVPIVMGGRRVPRRQWQTLLNALQTMEAAALEWFTEQRPKR